MLKITCCYLCIFFSFFFYISLYEHLPFIISPIRCTLLLIWRKNHSSNPDQRWAFFLYWNFNFVFMLFAVVSLRSVLFESVRQSVSLCICWRARYLFSFVDNVCLCVCLSSYSILMFSPCILGTVVSSTAVSIQLPSFRWWKPYV